MMLATDQPHPLSSYGWYIPSALARWGWDFSTLKAPSLQGTVGIGTQGNTIGDACLEIH